MISRRNNMRMTDRCKQTIAYLNTMNLAALNPTPTNLNTIALPQFCKFGALEAVVAKPPQPNQNSKKKRLHHSEPQRHGEAAGHWKAKNEGNFECRLMTYIGPAI